VHIPCAILTKRAGFMAYRYFKFGGIRLSGSEVMMVESRACISPKFSAPHNGETVWPCLVYWSSDCVPPRANKCDVFCLFLSLTFINDYKNKNWLQFLFIVKAAVLKQQISKFYPQIQRTEDSDHIYFSQRPFI